MPWVEGQQSLTGFLSMPALTKVTETRLFGGRYIRYLNFLGLISHMYESGAILGRVRRNKLSILTEMLVIPETEINDFIKVFQDAAKERLDTFIDEVGNEPDTFHDFIALRALRKLGCFEMPSPDLKNSERVFSQDMKALKKVGGQKVPFGKAWSDVQTFGAEGIVFGSSSPELTEKMYRNYTEHIDMDEWSKARKYGLDIPEKPDIVTLEEREESILGMVAAYTSEYYPELLDSLDLRSYVEEGGK